jgi:hypothetical protein
VRYRYLATTPTSERGGEEEVYHVRLEKEANFRRGWGEVADVEGAGPQ